jgi:hypothetical protein
MTAATKWNVARATDRASMARAIENLARDGWTIERDSTMTRERAIWLHLQGPRGLGLTIDLDGGQGQQREGVYILAWNIRGSEAKLNPEVMHGCNPYHFRKLTEVVYSFDQLLERVAQRMAQACNGSGFQ